MKNQIYVNRSISESLGIDYENDNKVEIYHTDPLFSAFIKHYGRIPTEYIELLDKKIDLHLEGAGYGWWNITNIK